MIRRSRSRRSIIAVIAALNVAIAAGLIFFIGESSDPGPSPTATPVPGGSLTDSGFAGPGSERPNRGANEEDSDRAPVDEGEDSKARSATAPRVLGLETPYLDCLREQGAGPGSGLSPVSEEARAAREACAAERPQQALGGGEVLERFRRCLERARGEGREPADAARDFRRCRRKALAELDQG